MEGGNSGGKASYSSPAHSAQPSIAQQGSPETAAPTGGLPRMEAEELWTSQVQGSPKRLRAEAAVSSSSNIELHEEVELCPLQREALDKVISTLDVSNSSTVITNPLRPGASLGHRRRCAKQAWYK